MIKLKFIIVFKIKFTQSKNEEVAPHPLLLSHQNGDNHGTRKTPCI